MVGRGVWVLAFCVVLNGLGSGFGAGLRSLCRRCGFDWIVWWFMVNGVLFWWLVGWFCGCLFVCLFVYYCVFVGWRVLDCGRFVLLWLVVLSMWLNTCLPAVLWFVVAFVISYLCLCSRLLLVFASGWNFVVLVVCIMFGGCCLGL